MSRDRDITSNWRSASQTKEFTHWSVFLQPNTYFSVGKLLYSRKSEYKTEENNLALEKQIIYSLGITAI